MRVAPLPHDYRVTVAPLSNGKEPLNFDVTNHDELLGIVDKIRARGVVPAAEAAEFAIGLKLFGEVLLRHGREPLFADLAPHFAEFMKRLKSSGSPQA